MSEKRTLRNVGLTRKYHWAYIGSWVVVDCILVGLIEAMVLSILLTRPGLPPSFPVGSVVGATIAIAVLVLVCLIALGTLWAHRIAGVHVRTARVLREVADGNLGLTLRYRASDDLEEVENAFDAMMSTLRRETDPVGKTPAFPSGESEEDRERRSWRNMELTSKYHYKYMSVWVLVTVGLLIATYFTGLLFLYVQHYSGSGLPLEPLTWAGTVVAVFCCALAIWRGFLTAHRLAGVHVKLAQTFQRVADGDKNVELRFRSYDRLENVEEAFKALMASQEATAPSQK